MATYNDTTVDITLVGFQIWYLVKNTKTIDLVLYNTSPHPIHEQQHARETIQWHHNMSEGVSAQVPGGWDGMSVVSDSVKVVCPWIVRPTRRIHGLQGISE